MLSSERRRDNRHKGKYRKFHLYIRKKYFTLRMVKHSGIVEFPSFKIFTIQLNTALGNLLWLTLFRAEVLD